MEINKMEFLELLYDLDRVQGQIQRVKDKICKICVANSESHPVTYTFNEEKSNRKNKK